MDHDHAPLLEAITRRSSTERRGPIAEFLAKKHAEQEPKTSEQHRIALTHFLDF